VAAEIQVTAGRNAEICSNDPRLRRCRQVIMFQQNKNGDRRRRNESGRTKRRRCRCRQNGRQAVTQAAERNGETAGNGRNGNGGGRQVAGAGRYGRQAATAGGR